MSTLNSITEAGESPAYGVDDMAKRAASLPARPRKVAPTTPGQVAGGILEDNGVSVRAAAIAMGVSAMALGNVVAGKSAVSPEMALRLGRYFGNGPDLWLRMQAACDLWHAEKKLSAELAKIKQLEAREA